MIWEQKTKGLIESWEGYCIRRNATRYGDIYVATSPDGSVVGSSRRCAEGAKEACERRREEDAALLSRGVRK